VTEPYTAVEEDDLTWLVERHSELEPFDTQRARAVSNSLVTYRRSLIEQLHLHQIVEVRWRHRLKPPSDWISATDGLISKLIGKALFSSLKQPVAVPPSTKSTGKSLSAMNCWVISSCVDGCTTRTTTEIPPIKACRRRDAFTIF
jgi:hypothetical protein